MDDAQALSRTSTSSRSRHGSRWEVQNLYIQMLADAGVIGLALLLGRRRRRDDARVASDEPRADSVGGGGRGSSSCALLTLAGEWASLGIVAGIPLQAATCLLLGLAAAGAAAIENGPG